MTSLPIDRVGVGLAALGRPAYITTGRAGDLPDRTVGGLRQRTWAVLDAAYTAGIRYVDVARSYGLAEEFLAGWLKDRSWADVVVGTKWGYDYVGGWRLDAPVHERKEHSLAMFRRQYAESRAVLGDRLVLYQVHSATLTSGLFDDLALLAALARLREEGVRIGLTTSGPAQAETVYRALETTVDGAPLFDTAQATWNLLEPSVGPALAEAATAGWSVIVKEAFANGRLTAAGDSGGPATPLAVAAARLGTTADAVALRAALDQPWAPLVLTGPASPQQLTDNLAALQLPQLPPLDLAQDPATYWRQRAERSWG